MSHRQLQRIIAWHGKVLDRDMYAIPKQLFAVEGADDGRLLLAVHSAFFFRWMYGRF